MVEGALGIVAEIREIGRIAEDPFDERSALGAYLGGGETDILVSYIDARQYPEKQGQEKRVSQNIPYEFPLDGEYNHYLFGIR